MKKGCRVNGSIPRDAKVLDMGSSKFEIYIPEYSSSIAEWRKAQQAPQSELPQFTADQKEVARTFGITEEEYARNGLAGTYGRRRMRERAQALGEEVQRVLEDFGRVDRVIAVSKDMDRGVWRVRIETPKRDVDVFVSQELAEDLFDSGSEQERERLRARVVSSLEESEPAKRG
jgi:ribosomal protein L31E